MSDVFDIYTIIFLALAVFIFLRLRSVLGQRTGRERPPYDPYSARDVVRSPATDKVVTLPPPAPAEAPAATGRAGAGRGRALEGHRRKRLCRRGRARCDRGGGHEFRRAAFHHRRARRLRDDRHHLCRGRSPSVAQSVVARSVRRLRRRDHRTRKPRRDRRDALCLDRRLDHHGAELRKQHGADHRPLRLEAGFRRRATATAP